MDARNILTHDFKAARMNTSQVSLLLNVDRRRKLSNTLVNHVRIALISRAVSFEGRR